MQMKRVFVITAVFLGVLFSLSSLLHPLQTAYSAAQATSLLYDSSLGNTPDQQNFNYLALNATPPFLAQATQVYSDQVTVLDTTPEIGDYAGYTVSRTVVPTLSQAAGFELSLDLRVISENHSSIHRAGFSLILLSEDLYGVELAFWEDEIWAQTFNGNDFVHAEGVRYDTTSALTNYKVTVISDTYLLSANDVPLLSGAVRQYTDWDSGILPDPYEQPNQLFLGDDTSSAATKVWIGDVALTTDVAPTVSVAETAVSLTESLTQTTFTVNLNMTSPLTTTVQYSLTSGTAVAGEDFVASSGMLTFSPGSLSETIQFTLLPDALAEPDETFNLQLTSVENGLLGMDTAVFTIEDDDGGHEIYLPFVTKP